MNSILKSPCLKLILSLWWDLRLLRLQSQTYGWHNCILSNHKHTSPSTLHHSYCTAISLHWLITKDPRMYLRWSARVAQLLLNQSCQFILFWLTGCTLQREQWLAVSSSHKPVALYKNLFLMHPLINWFSQRVLNWLIKFAQYSHLGR